MNDDLIKVFGPYTNINDLEDDFTTDIHNCETFGDIITVFNFWFGYVQGWCQSSAISKERQYISYNVLKDEVIKQFVFLHDVPFC